MSDKLTLYMIGHKPDAHYLDRLLGQIKPIVKFFSFCVTDDSEREFWQELIAKHDIAFTISYYHCGERSEFDFSKAREKALKAAEPHADDWCLWLDCDDTVSDAQAILEAMAANPDADAFGLPYDVSANQANLFKIRIHKPYEWKWVNKVHEELTPVGDKKPNLVLLQDCPVAHSPDAGKSNHRWHIELLTENSRNAPNDYAYIAKEYFNLSEWELAIEWSKKVIAIHPIEIEVFNAWMNIALAHNQLGRPEQAMDALHEAIKLRPWRREPYYFLAEIMGKLGADWHLKGLAYITACNAQHDRKEFGQNAIIYQCAGYKLHARYLMRDKQYETAHQVMLRAKLLDDEAREIILEIESKLKDSAIAERDS